MSDSPRSQRSKDKKKDKEDRKQKNGKEKDKDDRKDKDAERKKRKRQCEDAQLAKDLDLSKKCIWMCLTNVCAPSQPHPYKRLHR